MRSSQQYLINRHNSQTVFYENSSLETTLQSQKSQLVQDSNIYYLGLHSSMQASQVIQTSQTPQARSVPHVPQASQAQVQQNKSKFQELKKKKNTPSKPGTRRLRFWDFQNFFSENAQQKYLVLVKKQYEIIKKQSMHTFDNTQTLIQQSQEGINKLVWQARDNNKNLSQLKNVIFASQDILQKINQALKNQENHAIWFYDIVMTLIQNLNYSKFQQYTGFFYSLDFCYFICEKSKCQNVSTQQLQKPLAYLQFSAQIMILIDQVNQILSQLMKTSEIFSKTYFTIQQMKKNYFNKYNIMRDASKLKNEQFLFNLFNEISKISQESQNSIKQYMNFQQTVIQKLRVIKQIQQNLFNKWVCNQQIQQSIALHNNSSMKYQIKDENISIQNSQKQIPGLRNFLEQAKKCRSQVRGSQDQTNRNDNILSSNFVKRLFDNQSLDKKVDCHLTNRQMTSAQSKKQQNTRSQQSSNARLRE